MLCVLPILLGSSGGCGIIKDKADELSSAEANWEHEAVEQQRVKCATEHGTFADVDVGACSNGQALVESPGVSQQQPCLSGQQVHYDAQCTQKDGNGLIYFDDGPSIPYELLNSGQDLGEGASFADWRNFLWDAGVNHDFCYHNGTATYGYAQTDCDKQLLDDLVALCSQQSATLPSWFSKTRCSTNAQIMYAAVRAAGESSFEKMSTRVHYPAYKPLWQTLGLPQEPDDQDLRGAIDKAL